MSYENALSATTRIFVVIEGVSVSIVGRGRLGERENGRRWKGESRTGRRAKIARAPMHEGTRVDLWEFDVACSSGGGFSTRRTSN